MAQTTWIALLKQGLTTIGQTAAWHWFSYHFSKLPLRPLAKSIIDTCADCETKIPGLGSQFLKDLAAISGREKHLPDYEQLIQKLAELLVLRQLLMMGWPEGTTFQHEPAVAANGKRPELRVTTPTRSFLFEVKTPALLAHIENRNTNGFQAPGRALPQARLAGLVGDAGLTLPRDNPVKDFLIDSEKKFAQFKAVQDETSVLIIVWDDFIFEPITALKHEQCGLLTPNSYWKDAEGLAVQYPHIDAVVVIRHLTYLYRATREEALEERAHALDFGDEHALPNVFIPIGDPELVPQDIRLGLRAVDWDHPDLQRAADYRPKELVFWLRGASRSPPSGGP
jgi:hypothetical protein